MQKQRLMTVTIILLGLLPVHSLQAKLQLVSDKQMAAMGTKAFEEMKAKGKLSADPGKKAIAECIVKALVKQIPTSSVQPAWEVQVFEDASPNAFALPGGKVGIHTGMFDVVKSQDELAAVVGHEIAHVERKHSKKRIERELKSQLGISLLSVVLGSKTNERNTRMITQGAGLLTQGTYLLPHSREQESEADIDGQLNMARAGFDPNGAVVLWQHMMALNKAQPPQILSTHPSSDKRIEALSLRVPKLAAEQRAARAAGRKPQCF